MSIAPAVNILPYIAFFYPANLDTISRSVTYPDANPTMKCIREMRIANECLKFIPYPDFMFKQRTHFPRDSRLLITEMEQVQIYQRNISNSECLKHTPCENVVFVKELYEQMEPIIDDLVDIQKNCLYPNSREIERSKFRCPLASWESATNYLLMCVPKLVRECGCSRQEKELLTELAERSMPIARLLTRNFDSVYQDLVFETGTFDRLYSDPSSGSVNGWISMWMVVTILAFLWL
ncbi:hypothetical protein B9Z55_025239 [Caenorhabditis nigoni]|uniref:Uncharacterized protein n=1 Tax=Caenorhabditis nigoni TaxID=1611254 RepID=A0A2G5SYD4_9PELO|nr:hypothetical protein B9Z55_025239 [Caenorhabditis nigoni]